MKRWIKYLGIVFCLVVSVAIFSACDLFGGSNSGDDSSSSEPIVEPAPAIEIPTELQVTGYKKNIVVGDDFISKLGVKAKYKDEWREIPEADYTYSTNYTGSKYGSFNFKVYMNDFPSVEFKDTIEVDSLKIKIPHNYSVVYTGNPVDIKTIYEEASSGLYEVSDYQNMTNCGEYYVELKLTDTDKYVWVDNENNVLKKSNQKVSWQITKAEGKQYGGMTSFTAYAGDTLYDLLYENSLSHITWYKDKNNVDITNTTLVAEDMIYYGYYNENPQNYENTLVTFTISNFISVANYKIEYYLFDGEDYVLDSSNTEIIENQDIGKLVEVEPNDLDGYTFNSVLSSISGKVLKLDGLTLKLYYDLAE